MAKKKATFPGELDQPREEIDVWKLELFAFDVFEFASKVISFPLALIISIQLLFLCVCHGRVYRIAFAHFSFQVLAYETTRAAEFSPLKNALNVPSDNARTCRRDLSLLHMRWIEEAGGKIVNSAAIELL